MFVYIQNYVYILLCYINVWYTLLYMNILISILTNMIIYEVGRYIFCNSQHDGNILRDIDVLCTSLWIIRITQISPYS